jgi:hypothetical protein
MVGADDIAQAETTGGDWLFPAEVQASGPGATLVDPAVGNRLLGLEDPSGRRVAYSTTRSAGSWASWTSSETAPARIPAHIAGAIRTTAARATLSRRSIRRPRRRDQHVHGIRATQHLDGWPRQDNELRVPLRPDRDRGSARSHPDRHRRGALRPARIALPKRKRRLGAAGRLSLGELGAR